MLEVSDVPAPTAGVLVSFGALVYGFPIWALAYVILALGTYIYLNR